MNSFDEKIKEIFRDIMRHILSHDGSFYEIGACPNFYRSDIGIYCHCKKSWVIKEEYLRKCTIEVDEIIQYVQELNHSGFIDRLNKIKEKGNLEKNRQEHLLSDTGNPTISYLDL